VDLTSVAAVVRGAFVTAAWPVPIPLFRRAPSATTHTTIQAAAGIDGHD
jgi:hypothetical protein